MYAGLTFYQAQAMLCLLKRPVAIHNIILLPFDTGERAQEFCGSLFSNPLRSLYLRAFALDFHYLASDVSPWAPSVSRQANDFAWISRHGPYLPHRKTLSNTGNSFITTKVLDYADILLFERILK